MSTNAEKAAVRGFWNEAPCGTRDVSATDELARFRELERQRDEREPFIAKFARFGEARDRDVLEVGVGAGTDHVRFARAGAKCRGVDLTENGVAMTRRRLELEGLTSDLRVSDAEQLPFGENSFDVVYSWGVIHHTANTPRAATEIMRVLKRGGRFCVMVYNRHSLLAAQAWLVFALGKGHPRQSIARVLAEHVESPGTKAYSPSEAKALFSGARDVKVATVVTPYDMRVGRRRFLPQWTWQLIPPRLGWFHVITGVK